MGMTDHTPTDKTSAVSKNWLIGILTGVVAALLLIGVNDVLSRIRTTEQMGKENRERIVKVEELTSQVKDFNDHFTKIEGQLVDLKLTFARHEAEGKK